MRKFLFLILSLLIWGSSHGQSPGKAIPGIMHVKLTPEMAASIELKTDKSGKIATLSANQTLKTGIQTFDAVNSELKTTQMKRMFPYHPKYEKRQREAGLHLWYEMKIDEKVQLASATQRLAADPNITIAEPAIVPILYSNPPVNDPGLPMQWHYNNTGQLGGTPGADINLFKAWNKNMGNKKVIVAIIDGGIDTAHEDLKDNLWVNEAELYGTPGVDDDGDGYIDNIYGYNFVNNSGSIVAHDHGTHVAGTVGASNNNGKGLSGVAGGTGNADGVRLMSCQTFTDAGGASSFAESFTFAANKGAVIAQCSWGYETPGVSDQSTLDAIDYFIKYAGKDENGNPLPGTPMVGGIVIFAAGNSAGDGMYWPGCYEKVIAVAALTQYNKKAYYSNYADWVALSAPGGEMLDFEEGGVYSTLPGNKYGYMQGTSQACPHVSGIAALVLSQYGSESFTPDMLKSRLLAACHSVDHLNEGYIGKLGAGLIDAEKALEENKGLPPVNVTDLSAGTIAQDFVDVVFTAPSDPDNDKAQQYEIRYSNQPIDAGNYNQLPAIFKDAKDAGLKDTARVSGLQPLSQYYFAMKSIDIWGNKSGISNVLSVKTTAHASISVNSTDTVRLKINTSANTSATTQIRIENIADGMLSYEMDHHFVSDPRPRQSDYANRLNSYNEGTTQWAQYMIGQDGISGTFSAANRMTVTSDEFNLTHIRAAIATKDKDGELPTKPFTVFVVRGGINNPNEGKVVYQELCYYQSVNGPDVDLELGEQIKFSKDEIFWIGFNFPKEYANSVGANGAIKEVYGPSLYSENDGTDWDNIDNLNLYASTVVFRMFALSKIGSIEQAASFSPTSGQIAKGTPASVTAMLDASSLINGTYVSNIKVLSNDPQNGAANIPVKLEVSGHPSKYSIANNDIEFGTVIKGASKEQELEIENTGLGALVISNMVTNLPVFGVSQKSLTIAPLQKATISVTFSPAEAKNITGSLTLETNDGKKTIVLQGAGTNPPVADVTPGQFTFNGKVGKEEVKQFTIKNTGEYKLTYSIPAFDLSTFAFKDRGTGYVARTDKEEGGPTFGWENMDNATDITRFAETNRKCHTVDLGFSVNHYGKIYNQITVTSEGYVMMGVSEKTSNNQNSLPETGGPGKIVSPIWRNSAIPSRVGGKVLYKKTPEYSVVEFRQFGIEASKRRNIFTGQMVPIPATGTIDVQLVIYQNGRIDFRYDNFIETSENTPLFEGIMIGIENEASTDGIQIMRHDTQFLSSGTRKVVGFYPPAPAIVKSVSPASGLVVPGESVVVTMNLKADENLNEGSYENLISIVTNDPSKNQIDLKLNANVSAISKPEFATDAVNFSKVGKSYSKEAIIRLVNNGGKSFNVTNVSVSDPAFKVTPLYSSSTCNGYSSLEYKVEFTPVAVASYSSDLTIRTNVTGYESMKVQLLGEGIEVPAMVVGGNQGHDYTLQAGSHADTTITIQNDGQASLSYILGGNQWLQTDTPNPLRSGNSDKAGYSWVDNDQDPSLKYEWISYENATEMDVVGYSPTTYKLPFPFSFYGKEYNEVVVSSHGQVLFPTENNNQLSNAIYGNSRTLPLEDDVNNFICILRSPMATYSSFSVESRVLSEEFDDKVVITWKDMLSNIFSDYSAGTIVTCQMILFKDGRIKFQYKDVENAIWRKNSVIGIENEDGTDGLEISLLQSYVHNNLAIMITPGKKHELAAGQSVEVPVRVDAGDINDGEYTGNLLITTNDPGNSFDMVPFSLKVIGSSDIAVKDKIDYGTTYFYTTSENKTASYEQPFVITNKGSKIATFASVSKSSEFTFEDLSFPLEIEPGQSVASTLVFTPQSVPQDGALNSELTLNYGGDKTGQTEKVILSATVLDPPQVNLNTGLTNNYHKIKLIPGESSKHAFTLNNNGKSLLDYAWNLEFIDKDDLPGVQTSSVSGTKISEDHIIVPVLEKAEEISESSSPIATPYHEYTFVDSIGYIDYGYSTGIKVNNPIDFRAATRFKVGAEGFNLTHTANWYKSFNKDVPIQIKVLAGKNYRTAKEVYSKVFDSRLSSSARGQMEITDLGESLYFYPGESFWIVYRHISTEINVGCLNYYNIADLDDEFIIQLEDEIYFFGKELSNFIGMGFIMEAYSANKENVESWITLSPQNGKIDADNTHHPEIQLNSANLKNNFGDRYAHISLESNDPLQGEQDIYVEMVLNKAPVVAFEGGASRSMKELETLVIPITVTDPDNESFTFELISDAANNVENAPQTTLTKVESGYQFTINTPIGSMGNWTYRFAATDVNNLKSVTALGIQVTMGNRAPVALGIEDMSVSSSQAAAWIELNEKFSDPNGGALTYTAASQDENVAMCRIVDGSELRLFAVSKGMTPISVIARNSNGLSTETTFKLYVDSPTDISELLLEEGIVVYPNPVTDHLNYSFNLNETADVMVQLVSMEGRVISTQAYDALPAGNHQYRMNVPQISTGTYIFTFTVDNQLVKTIKVIR